MSKRENAHLCSSARMYVHSRAREKPFQYHHNPSPEMIETPNQHRNDISNAEMGLYTTSIDRKQIKTGCQCGCAASDGDVIPPYKACGLQ